MNGFFKWFKSGTKMKRWMFLILLGVILACYGVSMIMVTKELNSIIEVIKIIVSFVLGFTFIIVGLVYSQKRVLELLIENTDTRLTNGNKDVNVKSLIFNKEVYEQGPNIVAIGGGSGLNTVLKGLKNYTKNITGIVTISDYGRQATNSRKELNLLPLDDIRDSIISLAYDEKVMEKILNYEFKNEKLKDLTFGDIYLSAIREVCGDFTKSIETTSNVLNMTGKILPVTLDEMKICAELEDGTIIDEKDKIPEIVTDKISKISRIFVTPTNCRPAPGVIEAIENADIIIIGPGSLYTNVIPNLLIKNVSKAIKDSKAIKIYISNIMTELGQTDDFSISDHINAIYEHSGQELFDYCIYDTGEIVPEYIRKYNKKGADLVEQDITKVKAKGIKVLKSNLSNIVDDNIRHDSDAIAASIIDIICDDLKFKDKQNNPQFVFLNSRLKDKKKVNKAKIKIKEKQRKVRDIESKYKSKHNKKKPSKFNSKYKDRIESIQTSEEKRLQNIQEYEEDERQKNIRELEEKEKFLRELINRGKKQ